MEEAERRRKGRDTSSENDDDETVRVKRARHEGSASALSNVFLDALPCASRYERSLMHRETVTHILLTPHSNFLLTASIDGHVKFWKKQERGIEFVKDYRAHLAAITGLCCSADGTLAATISNDGTAKVFDVVNFDLMNIIKLDFTPRACCWINKRGRSDSLLAVSDEGGSSIRMYDGRGDGVALNVVDRIHRSPCHLMEYNERYDCIVSADTGGMVEYWSPNEPYHVPRDKGLWELKSKTDLYAFKKAKSAPTSLSFSRDGESFVTWSAIDRQIRIFDVKSGKVTKQFDESLDAIERNQLESEESTEGTTNIKLDSMEFGRRLATERELDSGAKEAIETGDRAIVGGCACNVVFDESGQYVIYASILGIKIRDIRSGKVEALLGRDESVRFMSIAPFQGVAKRHNTRSLALIASDNPLLAAERDVPDPTFFCTAFKRSRFYIFTRAEPDSDPSTRAGGDRDILNEKPTREEQTLAAAAASSNVRGAASRVSSSAILHTTEGDITLRLFPDLVPRTVENFVGLSRKGYYDGVLFHRVIKKFMLQTGDPLGDGTGGESLWGREFEDEFVRQLRHDRPYILSMANAGPNTNGSQFFITTVPTPWLDDKHTIFGRATGGFDVIHAIENARTEKGTDKPERDITIINVSLDVD